MSCFRLAYTATAYDGRFATITYPARSRPGYPTRERAEQVLASMPEPGRMRIVEEEEESA